ncbi:MAG: hypothetical protein H6721_23260 [Sandaracinus sp.]|nr:hypothetical protein [Sandaracinus sp.]MCB9635055.1 hypothetical protein [Sandaracinus sp.]
MTPTFRRDRLTGEWRLVAPTRAGVPLPTSRLVDPGLPSGHGRCPFCPGHEEDAGSTLARYPDDDAWDVRAVRNKYPAVGSYDDAAPSDDPDTQIAAGAHEVIVEGRDHEGDLVDFDDARLRRVFLAYRDRVAHHEDRGAASVVLFRNRGVRAGSSQAHPHAQLVSCSVVPSAIERRAAIARAHFDAHGRVLLDDERRDAVAAHRVVLERDFGTAMCPYAPATPFETWVVPHAHVPFAELDDTSLEAFARLVREAARRALKASGRSAWNLLFHLPPRNVRDAAGAFWLASVYPRSGPGAGLELVTATSVVSIAPELAAERMRAVD